MPSRVRMRRHGQPQFRLIGWLGVYEAATPGVLGGNNTTVRLDNRNEPQPDGMLMIEPARGGQASIDEDDYVVKAPELVAEVSASSVSFDLNSKLTVYQRSGIREYLVWRVADEEIDWFIARAGKFEPLCPDGKGVLRSESFPGLWLDTAALVRGDMSRVLAVLQEGLASPEHAAFLQR